MVWFGRLVLLAGVAAAASACTTNHDSLAKQPRAGTSNGGSGGGGVGGSGNTGNVAQGGRTNPDLEPAGDNVLTIVNGVVDAPSVRLCFARVDEEGQSAEFVGSPLAQLPYAASSVHTELEGFSFERDVIQPWLLAGELSLVDGLDCQQAVELAEDEEAQVTPEYGDDDASDETPAELTAPRLRARALAALPAGTIDIGRSILLVLSGCMGGAAFTDVLETAVCGDEYTPYTPTLQPLVVKLSRVAGFDKIGLQAVQGSISTGSVDMRVAGDRQAVYVFASAVSFGTIEPRPANTQFTAQELGVRETSYGVQAVGTGADVLHQASWLELMQAAGIDAILPARTYTTVLLGPAPILLRKGWWNEHAFALVDNDPTRAPSP